MARSQSSAGASRPLLAPRPTAQPTPALAPGYMRVRPAFLSALPLPPWSASARPRLSPARRPHSSAPVSASASAMSAPAVAAKAALAARVRAAISAAYPGVDTDPKLTASKEVKPKAGKPAPKAAADAKRGDYQANAALSLSKLLDVSPRVVADAIVSKLDVADICLPPTVAGPGFINLTLSDAYVVSRLQSVLADRERLGVGVAEPKRRIVVDFSSPNIAKDMHAGHLRSTIIGETLARTLEFLGHDVVRLNHTGDWGTQFGQLITYMREECPEVLDEDGGGMGGGGIGDLVEFYKKAKKRFDEDAAFKARAQAEVVELQGGNERTLKAWRIICDLSRTEFQKIYDRLGITITERGESFYNPYLPQVVAALTEAGLAEMNDGAVVVFLEGDQFKGRDGDPLPVIVRKSDGGFLYATTDLAAIRFRAQTDKADRILYVTDVGQSLHFQQVFQVARRAGLLADEVELEHVPFGLVQGEDGKKFKTRSGDTVKLVDLLDEAARRTRANLELRFGEEVAKAAEAGKPAPPARTEGELAKLAEHIGIAAVKYADLRTNRVNNYKFSFDKMVALDGDTAPYILYAFARVQGIYRTARAAAGDGATFAGEVSFVFEKQEERDLAKLLLQLPEVLAFLEADLQPHVLCEYIKSVTTRFNQFYEQCPVVRAPSEELQISRLALCGVAADTLKLCLGLLGIQTLDRI
jgi:arginyl-tRNA synthetase